MAVVDAEVGGRALTLPAAGFSRMPVFRQIGFMLGVAISVAIGVVVVLWSRTPTYEPLFSRLSAVETGEIIDSLKRAGIQYQLDNANSAILVPSATIQQARIKLAAEGLPRSSGVGFESLSKSQGFGVSQFMENARYQRALEEELARSIASLSNIRSARVHLAIPKQSAFVRNRRQPTASVIIDGFFGTSPSAEEISGIVYLVSSSVNELTPEQVTVIDQKGQLLTAGGSTSALSQTSRQRKLTTGLESQYGRQIEKILTPIVGIGKVRAQVSAEIDYTVTEQTQEQFDPNTKVMRSEQLSSQSRNGSTITGGIPGALSNQPPGQAAAPQTTAASAGNGNTAASATDQVAQASSGNANPSSQSSRAIHNFEVNKTIRHVQLATGTLTRLSIAVVIDQMTRPDATGKPVPRILSPEEENRFLDLAKQAVGFNVARGDTITLVNTPFSVPEVPEPMPEVPLWKQPWVWDIAKQAVAGIFLLLLVLLVIRPAFKSLTGRELAEREALRDREAQNLEVTQPGLTADGANQPALGAPEEQGEMVPLEAPGTGYEQHLVLAQQMVKEDPKRVAQVVRGWINSDG